MLSKPLLNALPPSIPAPAREAHVLPDIINKSNQYLLKKFDGHREKSVVVLNHLVLLFVLSGNCQSAERSIYQLTIRYCFSHPSPHHV